MPPHHPGAAHPHREAIQLHRETAPPARGLHIFFRELKRRRVLHAAAIYLGGGFAAIQAILAISDTFDVPRVWSQVAVIVVVAGFPVVLVLAWLFDLQPLRLRREREPGHGLTVGAQRWAFATLVLVLLAAGAMGTMLAGRYLKPEPPHIPPPGPADVAVLYFRDEPPAPRYVATSLTESLITELNKMRGLRVRGSAAVAPYRDSAVAPDSLRRALQVGTLVDGTLTMANDSLRATVQLVDAASGTLQGSRVVTGRAAEGVAFVEEVVRQSAALLRERVGSAVQLREWRAGTHSERAWELFQRGNDARLDATLLQGPGELSATWRALQRADSLLELAERADPAWNDPAVLRGWVAYRKWYHANAPGEERNPVQAEAALRDGIEHANRVLRRAPESAAALELRGTLRYRLAQLESSPRQAASGSAEAEEDLHRAVAREPHRAAAWSTLAAIRFDRLDYAAADADARHALEEDAYALMPGASSPWETLWTAYRSAFEMHDDEAAAVWCEEMRRRPGEAAPPVDCALQLMAWGSRPPDVGRALSIRNAADRSGPPQLEAANGRVIDLSLAAVLARAGMADSAEALIARARDAAQPLLLLREAEVRVLLHQHAPAIRLLQAFLRAVPNGRAYVRAARTFAPLHADPAFSRLTTEAG